MSTNKIKQKKTIKLINDKSGLLKKTLIESENIYGYSKNSISNCYLEKFRNLKACLQCPSPIVREV